eukprot:gene1687-3264_t
MIPDMERPLRPLPEKTWTIHRGRNISQIIKVIHTPIRNRKSSWFVRVLFLSGICYEISSAFVMSVISEFYLSISSKNYELFIACLVKSIVIITIVSILKSLQTFSSEGCALLWRERLVHTLHNIYFNSNAAYSMIHGVNNHGVLENPDQRMTQDVDKLTITMAKILLKVLTIPGIIIYYTYYLWKNFGWVAPVSCYVYFFVGAAVSSVCMRSIVNLTYVQEAAEGGLRYRHFLFRVSSEEIAFLRGQRREEMDIDQAFRGVVDSTSQLIRRRAVLYLISNWFSYFGSIVNYAAIGVSILYSEAISGDAEDLSSPEIAARMARGSFACLYLISAFSSVMESVENVYEVFGLSERVGELMNTETVSLTVTPHSIQPTSNTLELCDCGQELFPRPLSADRMHKSRVGDGDGDSDSPPLDTMSRYAELCEVGSGWDGNSAGSSFADKLFGKRISSNRNRSQAQTSRLRGLITGTSSGSADNLPTHIDSTYSGCVYRPLTDMSSAVASDTGSTGGNLSLDKASGGGGCVREEVEKNAPLGRPLETFHLNSELEINHLQISSYNGSSGSGGETSDIVLRVNNLTVHPPEMAGYGNNQYAVDLIPISSGQPLIKNLTFSVTRGMRLFIRGPSGCGKSSLLRVLAGLWPMEPGDPGQRRTPIELNCSPSETLILPQTPYIFRGSLIENVVYPQSVCSAFPSEQAPFASSCPRLVRARECIDTVALGHLVRTEQTQTFCCNTQNTRHHSKDLRSDEVDGIQNVRSGASRDLESVLSGGERQRLCLARAIFHRPQLLIMDESTSALGHEMEAAVFDVLKQTCSTIITVGHSDALLAHHTHCLDLVSPGEYLFCSVDSL